MKRKSKMITLTMMAGTAIVLGGCLDDDDQPKLVKDAEECTKTLDDQEGCREAAQRAEQDHEKMAPKYASQQDCEAQFGPDRCRKVESGGSGWFMPAMTGFMIGRLLDGSNSYRVQPACSNRDDLYTNGCGPVPPVAGGHPVVYPSTYAYAGRYSGGAYQPAETFSSSWTAGKVAASRAAASPAAIARGGFGGSAVGEAAVGAHGVGVGE